MSTDYWTVGVLNFRCKQEMKVFLTSQRGGKDEDYVYYTIYFSFWNTSFEGSDRESEL